MIKKIMSFVFILFFLSFNTLALHTKNLKIKYTGNYPYVRLFINNKAQGKLIRNNEKSFANTPGRMYIIKIRFGQKERTRSVFLHKSRDSNIVFYGPNKIDSEAVKKPLRTLIIKYMGNCPDARVFINGVFKGKIKINGKKSIILKTGITYNVSIRTCGKEIRRSVYLSKKSDRYAVFNEPSRD
ncbi:MAG: hypothetical protein KAR07_08970 [Spirochaetes bacterium]|nr:hypothetical protein [Spirochaetota bacterium]MCK5268287.1 hypothetical protein [Spirochaetota bacterium]